MATNEVSYPNIIEEESSQDVNLIREILEILKQKTEDSSSSTTALLAGLPHLIDRDDVFAYLDECNEDVVVVRKELVLVRGGEELTSRVFVRLKDNSSSYDIGWIVGNDVESCMVCFASFNFFRTRKHCYACGGIFCYKCTQNSVNLAEYPELGEVPICRMCYFGQSEISVCNRRRVLSMEDRKSNTPEKMQEETSEMNSEKSPQRNRSTSVDRLRTIELNRLRIKSDGEEKAALECTTLLSDSLMQSEEGDNGSRRPRRATHTGVTVTETQRSPPTSPVQQSRKQAPETASNVDDVGDSSAGAAPTSPTKPGRKSTSSIVKRLSSFGKKSHDEEDETSSKGSPMSISHKQRIVANPSLIITDGKPASCAGYLMKCGLTSAINKTWKKRFFVLTGNLLRYYDDQKMTEPATEKRTVIIAPTTKIEVEESDKKKVAHLIVIRDNMLEIEMLLGSNSEAVRDEWVRNLTGLYRSVK